MTTFAKSLIAAAALVAATASQAAIVYSVILNVGDGTAVGTITTDGTIGSVAPANITAFSILLSPVPGNPFLITDANAGILAAQNLVATATDLSFDFSGSGFWLMQNPNPGSGVNFLCFAASLCGNFSNAITMSTNIFGADHTPQQGRQIVARATAVPEPGSVALVAAALLAAAGASRRRQS